MKVLFSPSETKTTHVDSPIVNENSFIFPDLYAKRSEVFSSYDSFVNKASINELQQLFGIKDQTKIQELTSSSILTSLTCKAIERYNGVAYDHLSYRTLDHPSRLWIDSHVMIFSNLFGPILANNHIPYYKLQQGEPLGSFKPEIFYKEYFNRAITSWLERETVLDLRAGFYEKFYTLKRPYVTMKFLKNGKVVSHFAKAYRGEVLRQIAIHQPHDEKELGEIHFKGLHIHEIITQKLKREYVFTIID